MASNFFGRQRECRFYTAGCVNKMAVSVTGPLAVNELGGPVIPGSSRQDATQQIWDVGPKLDYCWVNFVDGGPTVIQRLANVSCLLVSQ